MEAKIDALAEIKNKLVNVDISEQVNQGSVHTLSPVIQFYGLCNMFKSLPSEIEVEAIDRVMKSEKDVASSMAILSTMATDLIWVNIYAFSAFMCTVVGDFATPMGKLRPFKAEDLAVGIMCIKIITGAKNSPFSENVNRFILSSLSYYGKKIPPKEIASKNMLAIIKDGIEQHDKDELVSSSILSNDATDKHYREILEQLSGK